MPDPTAQTPPKPLDDPDFRLADEALRRAAAKAVARAKAHGLEPIVANLSETSTQHPDRPTSKL